MYLRSKFNRDEAVRYALTYAKNPNPYYRYFSSSEYSGGDCSNFVSQCLRAGGAPMDFTSQRPWWYNNKGTSPVKDDSWSTSWAVAHSLYWCLIVRGNLKLPGLKGEELKALEDLELGDIIIYEKGNVMYHSAIITSFVKEGNKKVPRISQHSFNDSNIDYKKPQAEKTHFIKISI